MQKPANPNPSRISSPDLKKESMDSGPPTGSDSSPSWTSWIVATVAAAIAMISYVHQFVYPRTEGEKLEKRLERVEDQYREDIRTIRDRLDTLVERLR
jgi:hypothetical protein